MYYVIESNDREDACRFDTATDAYDYFCDVSRCGVPVYINDRRGHTVACEGYGENIPITPAVQEFLAALERGE